MGHRWQIGLKPSSGPSCLGRFVEDIEQGAELVEKLKSDPTVTVCNFRLIRNELRKAPKILPIYDKLVSKKVIDETKEISNLAKEYFKEYKINGGKQGQMRMLNDFKIVACATLLNCDIIATEDMKTMLNPISVKAYRRINLKIVKRTPTFYTYKDLKKKYF